MAAARLLVPRGARAGGSSSARAAWRSVRWLSVFGGQPQGAADLSELLREVLGDAAPAGPEAPGAVSKFARCLSMTTAAAAKGRRIQHRDFEVLLQAALHDASARASGDARRTGHGLQTYLAGLPGRHFLALPEPSIAGVVDTQWSVRDRDSLGYAVRVLLGRMMDEGVVPSQRFTWAVYSALVQDGDLFAAAALARQTRSGESDKMRSYLLAHASKAAHGEVCLQVIHDMMRDGNVPDRHKLSMVLAACTSDHIRPGNLFAGEQFLRLAMALEAHPLDMTAALVAWDPHALDGGDIVGPSPSPGARELTGRAAAEAEAAAAIGYGEAWSLLRSLPGQHAEQVGDGFRV
jgi:hypothetical protein